ncbi:MAG: NAD-dependent epimerase/dehydratase family protein, partial [Flavobacteriaceae bacterium]
DALSVQGFKVIRADIRLQTDDAKLQYQLDATDKDAIESIVEEHRIEVVYLMAAMLSATAERHPQKAWELNMQSLLHVLDLAKEKKIKQVFWPSSIAIFGPDTPKKNTPQETVIHPSTVYGISKRAGEMWCAYYHRVFGVDIRSLRYPGIISYKTAPGGGTTDYAIEIFKSAKSEGQYTSFIEAHTITPMIYMSDAITATIALMQAPSESITVRTSYNLDGLAVSPHKLEEEIKKQLPDFKVDYTTDYRQAIAASWPESINDQRARADWGYTIHTDLQHLVQEMLTHIK